MRKKHPSLRLASDKMHFDDLLNDPVVRFQKDNYAILYLIFAVAFPVAVPIFIFGEIWYRSILLAYFLRYLSSLHCTWFVNSTAHMFGIRPFNTKIQARENAFVAYAAFGEGYHNFHHTFPFDYRTSEDGTRFNLSRHFIDLCATLGLAYDLKKVSSNSVESSKSKTLALNREHEHHHHHHHHHQEQHERSHHNHHLHHHHHHHHQYEQHHQHNSHQESYFDSLHETTVLDNNNNHNNSNNYTVQPDDK